MARIRSIKPSFFASEDVSALPLRARLTWIGLWTHCDDAGRTKDNVKLIKAALWPLDNVSLADVEEDLATLAEYGRIVRYEVAGKTYLEITNWTLHQRIQKPTASVLPPIPSASDSSQVALSASSGSAHVGRGREGKGGDARSSVPLSRCLQHVGATDAPPCKACGDARRAYDAWKIQRDQEPTTSGLPPAAGTLRCQEDGHETELRDHCRICASDAIAAAS